jgi:hypothetical protein
MSELIELQKRLGLAAQLLADRLGLDPRTVIKRLADGKMTRSLRRKIRAATRHERKTLVSEVGNIILENYREHKDKYLYPDKYDLLQFIDDHLVIVDRLQSQNAYEQAEFMYILAHMNYSRAFHGNWANRVDGKARRAAAQEAFRLYNETAELVRGIDLKELTETQASYRSSFIELLELNAMETKWQMAKQRYVSLQECLKWLDEKNVLGRLRAALLVPHNVGVWTIPHNGLIFASQLNRVDEMEFFYGKLVEAQPGFSDWDNFSPGETPTLRQDSDLAAFRQAFSHLDKRNSKKETSMTAKIKAAAAAIAFTILTSSVLMVLLNGLANASNMLSNM